MDLKSALNNANFRFNKRYGQNFIRDEVLLDKIAAVADLKDTDEVLEIGVGAGTLTRALSKRAAYVYGYEIDKNLQPVLSMMLAGVDNAEVIFRDFMRENIADVEKLFKSEYVVVANLPYYITSPIVMKLIETAKKCKRIVVMVQKEVALRLCAAPATSDYGAITLAVDVTADASVVMDVDRSNFYPVPNVDSAVVKMDIVENKFPLISRKAFRDIVRCAFSSRRKTLVNNMMNVFKLSRADAEDLLNKTGIPVNVRGEALSTELFVKLSNLLVERKIVD
ncbi:MAG: ribosomal RNA small subunit methyltransferase A [Clostridia bacterium]|nr:ribosomal RNA small subunit methyltransferase A [Clostridia bacterium]